MGTLRRNPAESIIAFQSAVTITLVIVILVALWCHAGMLITVLVVILFAFRS